MKKILLFLLFLSLYSFIGIISLIILVLLIINHLLQINSSTVAGERNRLENNVFFSNSTWSHLTNGCIYTCAETALIPVCMYGYFFKNRRTLMSIPKCISLYLCMNKRKVYDFTEKKGPKKICQMWICKTSVPIFLYDWNWKKTKSLGKSNFSCIFGFKSLSKEKQWNWTTKTEMDIKKKKIANIVQFQMNKANEKFRNFSKGIWKSTDADFYFKHCF